MSANVRQMINEPIVLSRGVSPSALFTLFRMSVARLIRGRRSLVLILLFSLPLLTVVIAQMYAPRYDAADAARNVIFLFIPQTLLPLTALIFAAGMIQDEIEEQTLTYLLIRPIPRWLIYVTKLAATVVVTAVFTTVFTTLTYAVCYASDPRLKTEILPWVPLRASAVMIAALTAYVTVFALISVFTRRAVVVGIAYIVAFEGAVANIEFMIRQYTIIYQFRLISLRWLDIQISEWNLNPATAPALSDGVLNLALTIVVCMTIGAIAFSRREFRVKTPEGA